MGKECARGYAGPSQEHALPPCGVRWPCVSPHRKSEGRPTALCYARSMTDAQPEPRTAAKVEVSPVDPSRLTSGVPLPRFAVV